jgi:hypothetical protein
MKKRLFIGGCILGLLIGFCGYIYGAKYESSSYDAQPVVLYGSPDGGSTIVPLKTDTDGGVRISLDGDLEMGDTPYSIDGGTNGLAFDPDNDDVNEITMDTAGKVGIGTTTPATPLEVEKDDTNASTITDMVTIEKTTSGTPAAGIGAGIVFKIEDAGGSEEQGSIDISLSDVTDLAEDADLLINLNKAGTITNTAKFHSTGKVEFTGGSTFVISPSGNNWIFYGPSGGSITFNDSAANPIDINPNNARLDINGDITIMEKLRLNVDADTIADDTVAAQAATYTLEPTTSYVTLTCNDPDGCDITMSEINAVNGHPVTIVNISANTCNFADTAGVSELTGAIALGQYDVLRLMYVSDRWVQIAPVTDN